MLDRAYGWLCKQRRHWPDAADVWSFRREWAREKVRLRAELRSGRFRFGLQERVERENGEKIDLWSARDALALDPDFPEADHARRERAAALAGAPPSPSLP